MKLATEIRWQESTFAIPVERVQASERFGYDAVFTAEASGNDAFTPLAYLAAVTRHITLGACVVPVTARCPATTAMTYQTLHAISQGRAVAGLGNGNQYYAEALHAQIWGNPVRRMRDFTTLLRQAFAGAPMNHSGREIAQPIGGVPAMPTLLEPTPDIPVLMAASGPQMISLAAEIADGWFPASFAPGMFDAVKPLLERGFARAGVGKGFDGFDIWAHVDCIRDDDVSTAMRPFKEYVVAWLEMQKTAMSGRGYDGLADRLMELRSAGRFEEAVTSVPDEYIDEGWLVGPTRRIARRVRPWLDSGATGLIIRYGPQGFNQKVEEPLDVFEAIAAAVHR